MKRYTLAIAILALMVPVFSSSSSVAAYADYFLKSYGDVIYPDTLVYDDGSAYWLTWGGLYRGVWFDTQDFVPTSTGITLYSTEYWFYHHPSYPWDSSDFNAELWNGFPSAPMTQLNQRTVTATHYSAIRVHYSPPEVTDRHFWVIVNSEMSAGGWPSTLCDNTPNFTGIPHSFYSDDFIVWEPWETGMATSTNLMTLEWESWGGIKGLFR